MCAPGPHGAASEAALIAAESASFRRPTASPFGADDEIGMLNLVRPDAIQATLSEVDAWRTFDLAVDYFIGMPNWTQSGEAPFQIWMSSTPSGGVLDDQMGIGDAQNQMVGRSGDCISMYTHSGTHVDTLNHMGYGPAIWNNFNERKHLGSRHWLVAGAEKHPPIVARGVLIDVAGAHGVEVLPDSYGIGADEIKLILKDQGTELRPGDVVLIRTGRMSYWPDADKFMPNEPGLNRDGAEFLARSGAMMIGADNIGLEQIPADDPENWQVVHTYLLAEAGVPIMEIVDTQELSAEGVHEFAFIGACLKIRGATGSPIRPIAIPLRSR
jgi:kynurenine formamidase